MERLTKKILFEEEYFYKLPPEFDYSIQSLIETTLEWEKKGLEKLGKIEDAIESHLNKFEIFVKNIDGEGDLVFAEGTLLLLKELITKEEGDRLEELLRLKEAELGRRESSWN